MKKTLLVFVLSIALSLSMSGCGKAHPAETAPPPAETPVSAETPDAGAAAESPAANGLTVYQADGSAVSLEAGGEGVWRDGKGLLYYLGTDGVLRARGAEDLYLAVPAAPERESPRQDGERFEAVIQIEGMDETVRYEHIRDGAVGFEMDYDYDSFVRRSEPGRETFVSIYDDPEAPENYLELVYSAADAEAVASYVRSLLSQEYDLLESERTLERAGSCIRIEASELKGTGRMADQLQAVFIIPASDGCRVATEHFSAESAEGFGRRFSYMLNTLTLIQREGERRLSDDQALSAVRNYCYAADASLEDLVNGGEYPIYWEIASSDEAEIVVLYRSYTGAQMRYYIDRSTGDAYETAFVPGITPEEERTEESLNAWDYLG